VVSESDVLGRIKALVEEEHTLRGRRERDEIAEDTERERLRDVEAELDRCWDLLRQRRALRESGQNPEAARARPADEVEGYTG
jgi:hypothetical protein